MLWYSVQKAKSCNFKVKMGMTGPVGSLICLGEVCNHTIISSMVSSSGEILILFFRFIYS